MQFKRSFSRLAATAAATLFIAAVAFARGHDHAQMQGQAQGKAQAIKVGKRGEITLTQPTKVGSIGFLAVTTSCASLNSSKWKQNSPAQREGTTRTRNTTKQERSRAESNLCRVR